MPSLLCFINECMTAYILIFFPCYISLHYFYLNFPYHTKITHDTKKEFSPSIRRFRSMNSLNTVATSIATSIDSIPSERNQNDSDLNDDDDFEIIESTRLWDEVENPLKKLFIPLSTFLENYNIRSYLKTNTHIWYFLDIFCYTIFFLK